MAKFIPVEPEKWAEMVKAQAEVAELRALVARMDETINVSQAECRRLKAEVEQSKRINTELLVLSERQASDIRRLTKAGDAMATNTYLMLSDENGAVYDTDLMKFVRAWNAAKQGGQP